MGINICPHAALYSVSCVTLPLFITSNVSSTNLFHSLGLQFTGAVAITRFSNHSIYKFAIIGDTGLPIAVPNLCWYITPQKVKYVVVKTNSSNSMMSPMSKTHKGGDMDQEHRQHESRRGSYQLSHIWDRFLHTDDRYRKLVPMKTSNVKSKRR